MPIRITVVGGPLEGRSYEFPDSQPVVTVGRHPSCDVVFPADFTDVSRYHLALERKLARYRLLMQADNPVFVDGEPAYEGDELPLAAKMALGHVKGPVMLVETVEDDDLPVTARYARHDSPGRIAEKARRRASEARRVVVVLTLMLIVAMGSFAWMTVNERAEVARLVDGAYRGTVRGHTEEQLATALRNAAPSVYLVALKDQAGLTPFGTAFVVGKGVLATNAHVAQAFERLMDETGGKGARRMVVRASGATPKDLVVRKVLIHPAYESFSETWDAYGPLAAGANGQARKLTEAGGYDVALLYVDEAESLGPPLAIAPDVDLVSMEPGDPVGYVGFPVESAALGGVNLDDPQAQLQIGRLTALTDFFLVKSDPAERQLLQHSLPVQGGASGSPVLDRNGAVVGVLSGGNLVEIDDFGTRVPSGVGVNFAQRADLVRELLAGAAAEHADERRAYWDRRLKRYQTEVDLQLQDWATSHGADRPPAPILQVEGKTAANKQFDMPVFVQPYTLPRDGSYLFLATSRKHENIDMMLIEQGEKGPKMVGLDAAPDWYPSVEFTGEKDAEMQIVVPGPAQAELVLRVYYLPAKSE